MEYLTSLIEFILHIDKHLTEFCQDYGLLTYLILFAIVFAETGLVVTPFLPGDSLLFAAGILSGNEENGLNVFILFLVLFAAAVLGDTVNYLAGKFIGPKIFSRDYKLLKRSHLLKTQEFYEKHGGKTIILARFIPIIRTFAPFVAGIGTMDYKKFISYNLIGGLVWVGLFTFGGYALGSVDWVKVNFSKIVLLIIAVSLLPVVWEAIKPKKKVAAV
jgi:membrane-associated protein